MRPELLERIFTLWPSSHPQAELRRFYTLLGDYPRRSGKGFRSELLLRSAEIHGVSPGGLGWERALWLAAALELFQNWVLIHDDIEDDSEERRGQPALHRQHGLPVALNVGDALHAYMWAAVHRSGLPQAVPEFLNMVHRTAEGQHLDLSWVQRREWQLREADYLQMVQLKTAHYTVIVPLRLGALVAGLTPPAAFELAGLSLGSAFQIRDDVLNLVGEAAQYGKEIAGDLWEGKRTLITLHWLGKAREAQRAVFLEQMNRPRPEKDPAQIAQIHQWLLESGSVAYAQRLAQTQAQLGLAQLQLALADAPEPGRAQALLQQLKALATREA